MLLGNNIKLPNMKPHKICLTPWKVLIVGAGISSLFFAINLKKRVGARCDIQLCDPSLAHKQPKSKQEFAFALNHDVFESLCELDEQESLRDSANPIHSMVISDTDKENIHVPSLSFHQEFLSQHLLNGRSFSWVIDCETLIHYIWKKINQYDITLIDDRVLSFQHTSTGVQISFDRHEDESYDLLIAADGSCSSLRDQAKLGWIHWDYPQASLVGYVHHPYAHENIAIQHFTPEGLVALLPMRSDGQGHRSCVIWSIDYELARHYMTLPLEKISQLITRSTGHRVGPLQLTYPLTLRPLRFGVARKYFSNRLVLLGDAAHSTHPLAGQGLNLGLRDARVLAELMSEAMNRGFSPASADVLSKYTQQRRAEAVQTCLTCDTLYRIFRKNTLPFTLIRKAGIQLIERSPLMKTLMMKAISGL